MKKIISIVCAGAASITILCGAQGGCGKESTPSIESQAQTSTLANAQASIPIPIVSYFQERRTIAKWTERWDKPNLPCYVYLVSFGKVIGYYVTDGKPSSTRSYVLPEYKEVWRNGSGTGCSWSGLLVPTADLDGTYGTNNPGIRFFTAEGTAVEWAGDGASYIYSDAPLPIDVPRFNVKR
jgi:hypothetical protein